MNDFIKTHPEILFFLPLIKVLLFLIFLLFMLLFLVLLLGLFERKTNAITLTDNDKKQFLEKLLPGDIIVVRNMIIDSPPIIFIRLANFSKLGFDKRLWNHCALYIGDDKVVEAFPKGVELNKLTESYLNGKFEVVAVRKKSALAENLLNAKDECLRYVGNTYDYGAVAYFLLLKVLPSSLDVVLNSKLVDKLLNKKNGFFCSELVANGLLKAQEYSFDRDADKIMPVDFYNDFCFDTVTYVRENNKDNFLKKFLISSIYWIAIIIWLILIAIVTIIVLTIIAGTIVFLWEKLFSKPEKSPGEIDSEDGDKEIKKE